MPTNTSETPASVSVVLESTAAERRQGAQLLANRRASKIKKSRLPGKGAIGWIILVVMIVALQLLIHHDRPARQQPAVPSRPLPASSIRAIGLFVLGAVCLITTIVWGLRPLRAQRLRWDGTITSVFHQDGLTIIRPGKTHALKWRFFRGFDDGPDVLVLRTAPKHGLIFPKRLFQGDSQLAAIVAILRENVSRPGSRGFPVIL
jgi:hypothetical protein